MAESFDPFEVLPTIKSIDPSSAAVGEEIKVIGTGFHPVTASQKTACPLTEELLM